MLPNHVSEIRRAVASLLRQASSDAKTVVLAVSGGADSLCLADAALATRERTGLQVVVAHLDHSLRSEASQQDAEFVRAYAEQHGVLCAVERADVLGLAAQMRCSVELAARRARYAFLARVARKHGARAVALAHHADDQAETLLLRLLRGTGSLGLRGMRPLSPLPGATDLSAARPLLRFTRAQIERYCQACGLQPRHDASNQSLDYRRNQVRHEVLPFLERYNPNLRATLARLADIAADEAEFVKQAAQQTLAQIAQVGAEAITVDRMAWRALHAALQRAVLRQAVEWLHGSAYSPPYAAIEEAREVLNSSAGAGEIALTRSVRIKVSWRMFTLHVKAEPASL
ncbi:MAG: tRNA lysidine(34) synthetase TilS [Anaerolineae bacterium]|nr:tRNA lysidine(34) synthetase TilS [Thermoflexales bacterium]MDW8395475.1 tRNA lysidine(34) synthetase TilS [Anaerolineae bacterium]